MMQDNFPIKHFKCGNKGCKGTVEVKGAGIVVTFTPCDEHEGFPCNSCGKLYLPNGIHLFDVFTDRGDAYLKDGKVVLIKDGKVAEVLTD